MPKVATVWRPVNGQGDVENTNEGFSLLQENGDNLLQENNNEILLNETVVTSKPATVWEDT